MVEKPKPTLLQDWIEMRVRQVEPDFSLQTWVLARCADGDTLPTIAGKIYNMTGRAPTGETIRQWIKDWQAGPAVSAGVTTEKGRTK